nr:leucine-rich repeat domain-containing protein [Candidatus Sigynarchaeota archaeon]
MANDGDDDRQFVTVRGKQYHLSENHVLNLSNLDIASFEEIQELDRLGESITHLNLDRNKIKKIEGISSLINLKQLILSENRISCIENLEHLRSLEDLNLDHNQLTSIDGLEQLKELKILVLNNNQIHRITGLQSNTRLEVLFLNNNKLQSIHGLEGCKNLFNLDISKNQLSNIDALALLPNLRVLDACYNNIKSLPPLDEFVKNYEELSGGHYIFANNQIDAITINKNIIVYIIELQDNRITEVPWLDKVWAQDREGDLFNFPVVDLSGNPLTPEAAARYEDFYQEARDGERTA